MLSVTTVNDTLWFACFCFNWLNNYRGSVFLVALIIFGLRCRELNLVRNTFGKKDILPYLIPSFLSFHIIYILFIYIYVICIQLYIYHIYVYVYVYIIYVYIYNHIYKIHMHMYYMLMETKNNVNDIK